VPAGMAWLDNDRTGHRLSREALPEPEKIAGSPGRPKQTLVAQAGSADISILWHELLSPLTLIKGYTSTMLQLNGAITEEQRGKYLRGIDSASDKMVYMLEQFRDVTRLEENGQIHAQHVSMRDLLHDVLSEMQNQTMKHVIVFRPSAPLPRVIADPEKIALVVTNLVNNAMKYSPQGGDIEVELRLVRTDLEFARIFGENCPAQPQFPSVVVSVADSGIGLPEAELNRIFEKFYRVSNQQGREVPGFGLGLYICKIIINSHHGQIWASNRTGGGCVFSFSLPLE
jgi:signal transduction histidine kinase